MKTEKFKKNINTGSVVSDLTIGSMRIFIKHIFTIRVKSLNMIILYLMFPLLMWAASNNLFYVYQTNYGYINWSNGTITAIGRSSLPKVINNPDSRLYDENNPRQPRNIGQAKLIAKHEAKMLALANAKKLILSICVDSGKKVSEYIANPAIDNKVNNFINENFKLVDVHLATNRITVKLKYHLFGDDGFLSLNSDDDWDSDFIHFNYEKIIPYPQTNQIPYEGLVVSAPDIEITPALNPRIYAENGNLIYDSRIVQKKIAVQTGLAVYGKTPYNLLKSVNLRFYHCVAIRATTFKGCDIVISDDDARTLLSNPETIKNLKKAIVIILSSDKK